MHLVLGGQLVEGLLQRSLGAGGGGQAHAPAGAGSCAQLSHDARGAQDDRAGLKASAAAAAASTATAACTSACMHGSWMNCC